MNVWVALSDRGHVHYGQAIRWLGLCAVDTGFIFSRFTQLGLLRLLTNRAAMGERTLTLGEAWQVYDRWLEDPRIEFQSEPNGADAVFRDATSPFAQTASNRVGDCYILALAMQSAAILVTFDQDCCASLMTVDVRQ